MTFSEKLTFLLNVSGSTNAELARAANIDPSQVSRLKNGTRNTPKRAHTIELMAEFFAERCTSDYQRSALAETIGDKGLVRDRSQSYTADVLCRWFRSRQSDSSTRLDNFMRNFEGYDGQLRYSEHGHQSFSSGTVMSECRINVYYGNEGRRNAVLECLDELLAHGEPCQIMLINDENLDWMTQDREYNAMIIGKTLKLAERGFTLRRIVSSFRDSSMAIESLERWMPLYMTGALASFYYPRLRDGIFRHLMIVAPGNFTLTSTAVGDQHECGSTHVCYDERAIIDDERTFHSYLERCVPLTEAYVYDRDPVLFSQQLLKYHQIEAMGMSKWMGMSRNTLPREIVDGLAQPSSDPESVEIVRLLRELQDAFERNLENGIRFVEIIRPHSVQQVLDGEAVIVPSLLLPYATRECSAEEYRMHIKHVLELLEKYPNYFVIIDEGDMPDCELHVKEDKAALLVRTSQPFTLFNVTERNTISACQEYFMMYATLYGSSLVIQRRHAIEKLRVLYEALGKA